MIARVAPMSASDVPDAAAIELASFGAGEIGTRGEAHLREELARGWARLWMARDDGDGRALGFLLAWHVADELSLLDVAVAPAERRRGVGRALVEELIAYGRREQARLVLLEVRASNAAALALYRALGFEGGSVRRAYYSDGEDALEMTLVLAP